MGIPKPWFVYEAGQSMAHMLWYVHLLNFDDVYEKKENVGQIFVEEYDTFEEALSEAIKQIK